MPAELECLLLKEALLSELGCLETEEALVLLLSELACLPEELVDIRSEFERSTKEEFLVSVLERFAPEVALLSELHLLASEAVLLSKLVFLLASLLEGECLPDDDDRLVSEDACFLDTEECLLELDKLLLGISLSDEVLLDAESFLFLTFPSSTFELYFNLSFDDDCSEIWGALVDEIATPFAEVEGDFAESRLTNLADEEDEVVPL